MTDFHRLPDYAFNYSSQVLFLHQELTKDTPKDVYNLPEVAYKYPDLVVFLARKNIDVYNLTEEEYLAFMPFKDHYQKILELYSEGNE